MTTAVALGLMLLAFEPKEPGIMQRPPRDPGQPILTGVLIERIVLVSFLMLAGAYGVFLWEQQRTGFHRSGPHDSRECQTIQRLLNGSMRNIDCSSERQLKR